MLDSQEYNLGKVRIDWEYEEDLLDPANPRGCRSCGVSATTHSRNAS
jgi:hypothetical protein